MRKTVGLTLIEILVSSAIIMTVAGLGLAAYNDFNNRQILNSTADELKNNLRQARGWAMAGWKQSDCTGTLSGYQISFIPNNYQYKVAVLCPNEIAVNTFSYSDKVTINYDHQSFVFQALTGETGDQIQIDLVLGTRSKSLNINSNGEIN
jgi:Tfp pilus assembly protein FimT